MRRLTEDRLAFAGLVLVALVLAGAGLVTVQLTRDAGVVADRAGTGARPSGDDALRRTGGPAGLPAPEPARPLTVVQGGQEFVLVMDFFFPPGSSVLLPRAAADLEEVADRAQRHGHQSLVVTSGLDNRVPHVRRVGHGPPLTAGSGWPVLHEDTMQLWRERAEAVAEALASSLPGVAVSVETSCSAAASRAGCGADTITPLQELALDVPIGATAGWLVVVTAER